MRFNELAKAAAGLLSRAQSSANSNAQSSPNAGGPAEDPLQTIIDTIPALVVRRGADGKIDYVNRAWRAFTGLSGPESYEAAAIHPDDRARVEQPWLSHLGKGEQFEAEYRVRSADGEYRWLSVRRTPLRDNNGNVIAWYGVGYDIEDRKRAEIALQTMIDTIPALVVRRGADGKIDYVNQTWCTFTGLSQGQPPETYEAAAMHPDDRPRVDPPWREHLSKGESFETEYRLQRADGEYRWLSVHRTPLRDNNGKVIAWYGVGYDIEDKKRAEGQLRQLQAEFAHAARMSMLGELATSIAHEVNQPLTAILTNAETSLRWLQRDDPNITKVEQLTSRIVKNAQHASDIVKRIRGMTTKNESEHTALDLNEVVNDALLFIRHDIESHSIDLNVGLDPQLPAIAGDRVQLQQVVINLLVNSIQALSSNVARRQIDLHTSCDKDGRVVFSIRDSGPGIPDNDIDKIFESFFTTKSAGMGIGLAICRSIITAHGGSILVANHPSGGAAFQFWLPAK